jgi:hypothetical protein
MTITEHEAANFRYGNAFAIATAMSASTPRSPMFNT